MSGQRLVHVAIEDDWEACARFGEYDVATRATMFDDTGFIHAATASQLAWALTGTYADLAIPLVLVVLDEEALAAEGVAVAWDPEGPADGGTPPVPRLLGAIPTESAAVVARVPLERAGERWLVPDLAGLGVRP